MFLNRELNVSLSTLKHYELKIHMRKLVFTLFASMALLWACDKQTEQQATEQQKTSEALTDFVKTQILAARDSMNVAWDIMIATDDSKFQSIQRLLQEVSYTKKYDVVKQSQLVALADSVKKSRFTKDSMPGEMIDKFDAATDSLVLLVFSLVDSNPEMASHTITEPLKTDIQVYNSIETVLSQRTRYDRWAKEYNSLLKKYNEQLKQAGEPFSSLKKAPLFEIQLES